MIKQRLITALVLGVALLLVLFAAPLPVAAVVLGGLVIVGAWEWSALGGCDQPGTRVAYAAVAIAAAWLAGDVWRASPGALLWLGLSVWILGLIWMLRYPVPVPRAFALGSGMIIMPLGWLFLISLLGNWGAQWTLFLFLLVAAADVGAFFSGRAFGRHKLAVHVSPGKTWEGVAGGVVAVALVGAAGSVWFDTPVLPTMAAAVAVAAFSVLGDLTISMLKRSAGIKDSGRIFPGHGGVLDRVDSLLAALPLFILLFGGIRMP
ncbi:MAG: phosphatidate cytidylyltransferase [Gammaproteobacteria bacterium]|jgi:phosphatidate cytidylyltransferase